MVVCAIMHRPPTYVISTIANCNTMCDKSVGTQRFVCGCGGWPEHHGVDVYSGMRACGIFRGRGRLYHAVWGPWLV